MWIIINILAYTGIFCVVDAFLHRICKLEGVYYALHAIHNALIVYTTVPEVWFTMTDFLHAMRAAPNLYALQICYALHFYHVICYWRKFRFDDYLHHILMIGVALPIGGLLPSGTLLGFSLFFTTGLPGGIDYFLLFLTRNDWLDRDVEKRVNAHLNVWIRAPGCIANAVYTVAYLSLQPVQYDLFFYGGCATAILTFWNGLYFMQQVVVDAAKRNLI